MVVYCYRLSQIVSGRLILLQFGTICNSVERYVFLFLLKYLVKKYNLHEVYHQCGSSVANEGKSESGVWEYFNIHSDIYKCLDENQ